jgi:hypothetical protein
VSAFPFQERPCTMEFVKIYLQMASKIKCAISGHDMPTANKMMIMNIRCISCHVSPDH